ncbi:UNVERIFIED_ORG: hypothetical protein FHR63_002635 [Xanthomonas campestris]
MLRPAWLHLAYAKRVPRTECTMAGRRQPTRTARQRRRANTCQVLASTLTVEVSSWLALTCGKSTGHDVSARARADRAIRSGARTPSRQSCALATLSQIHPRQRRYALSDPAMEVRRPRPNGQSPTATKGRHPLDRQRKDLSVGGLKLASAPTRGGSWFRRNILGQSNASSVSSQHRLISFGGSSQQPRNKSPLLAASDPD